MKDYITAGMRLFDERRPQKIKDIIGFSAIFILYFSLVYLVVERAL